MTKVSIGGKKARIRFIMRGKIITPLRVMDKLSAIRSTAVSNIGNAQTRKEDLRITKKKRKV